MTEEKRITVDTVSHIYFYEQDYYVLSNFSAFSINNYGGYDWSTAEHCYQAQKFLHLGELFEMILKARSAHDAFKIAQQYKENVLPGWDNVKLWVMKQILITKVYQHEYVYRKLKNSGNRELVENSWRDPYWGIGPNQDGENHLGKLWMEVRAEMLEGERKAKLAAEEFAKKAPGSYRPFAPERRSH